MFVFSHIFPLLWEFSFPIFWDLHGFPLHLKYLRNSLFWNVCFFPILFQYYGDSLCSCFGDCIWISASPEIFKNPINLKCLCFPILFPYYGNPLFPYFGNCMDFCFKEKIPEILNFEMFVFPYFFLTLGIHFSHILGIACINVTHEICKKPITFECLCFPRIQLFPVFSELYGFLFHAK